VSYTETSTSDATVASMVYFRGKTVHGTEKNTLTEVSWCGDISFVIFITGIESGNETISGLN